MSGITNIKYISSFKLGDQVVLDDRKPYEGLEDLGMLPEGTSLSDIPDHVVDGVASGQYRYYRVDIDGAQPVHCMVLDDEDKLQNMDSDELHQYFEQLFDGAEFPPNPIDATFQGREWMSGDPEQSLLSQTINGGATGSPEDGENIYVRMDDDKISAFMLDRSDVVGTMLYKDADALGVAPIVSNNQMNWGMNISGEPFECFAGVGGLEGLGESEDDAFRNPDTEIHYLFGATPETAGYHTSKRLEALGYDSDTNELYTQVQFKDGHQRIYLAPYSVGMKGYREMIQMANDYIEEYTQQFDLDVSDLDTEDAQQL